MKASVLFPTYNRSGTLRRVLEAYAVAHERAPEFELVVVDDGSTDNTREVLASFAQEHPGLLKPVFMEKNVGPARARNAALPATAHELVIIAGDDIVPPANFVSRHLAWHGTHPAAEDALLGRVVWPAEIDPSRFMQWLEKDGSAFYFDYPHLQVDRPVGGQHFYTCNVSLKRELLFRTTLFDESFRYASHEDLELGHRLEGAGMRLWYEPTLTAFHWHNMTFVDVVRRIYTMGYSAETYWSKVPDPSAPSRLAVKRGLRLAASTSMARSALHYLVRRGGDEAGQGTWRSLLMLAYWVGLADAWRQRPRMILTA